MKKIISIILIIGIILNLRLTGYATQSGFNDTGSHWAKTTIENWQDMGLINGYTDGSFQPEASINRVEFIALVNRIYGYYASGKDNYLDVNDGDWYQNDTAIARENGYTSIYGEVNINPLQEITRQEVCAILAIVMNLDLSEEGTSLEGFIDSDTIPDWSLSYIEAMVSNGYLNGYSDNSIRPWDNITRAEAVVMLDRVMGELINGSGTYGGDSVEVLKNVSGNLTVNTRDVILENMVVEGDLILAAGIGDGNVGINNVTVKGRTIINGGGENSITITGSNLSEVRVYKLDGKIRVVLVNSEAERIIQQSGGKLEGDYSGSKIYIDTEDGQGVVFDGEFGIVEVDSDVNIEVTDDSSVNKMTFNSKATVTGKGNINKVILNKGDVVIEQEVNQIAYGLDTSGVEEEVIYSDKNTILSTAIGELYNNSIYNVPTTTLVEALKAGITVSQKASVEIIDGPGGRAVTNQDATVVTEAMRIQVKAEDGSKAEYSLSFPDYIAPVVTAYAPEDNSMEIATDADLVLTFDEEVQLGSGNITIKKSLDDSTAATIDVTDTTQVSCDDNQVTISPTINIEGETSYYITIDSGAVQDQARPANNYSGIDDTTTWTFITKVDDKIPEIISLSASNNGYVGIDDDLVMTFDEAIQGVAGKTMTIYQGDGTIEETIDADGANVTIVDHVVTINPTNDLTGESEYYVLVEAGAFTDTAITPNDFVGIDDVSTWNFSSYEGVPPTYMDSTVAEAGENEQELKFTSEINENGLVYYAVTSSSSIPSAANIINGSAGSLSSGAITLSQGEAVSTVIDGLMPAKTYYVYLVAEDQAGNLSEVKQLSAAAKLIQGDGTAENPFKIWAIEDLKKVGSGSLWYSTNSWSMSSHYILMDDLDFNDSNSFRYSGSSYFSSIGTSSNPFSGNFDGNNKSINGFIVGGIDYWYHGLFGYTNGAYIYDVSATNIQISGREYVGGLVGSLNNSTVSNCYTSGIVYYMYYPAGKIYGESSNSTVTGCSSSVNLCLIIKEDE